MSNFSCHGINVVSGCLLHPPFLILNKQGCVIKGFWWKIFLSQKVEWNAPFIWERQSEILTSTNPYILSARPLSYFFLTRYIILWWLMFYFYICYINISPQKWNVFIKHWPTRALFVHQKAAKIIIFWRKRRRRGGRKRWQACSICSGATLANIQSAVFILWQELFLAPKKNKLLHWA